MRFIFIFLFSLSAVSANDFWRIGTVSKVPSSGYNGIYTEGYDTLEKAILSFQKEAPNTSLKHIWMGLFFDTDARSQSEIRSYLEKHYPSLLSAALESSGNLHNPKVTPLREPYQEAILATSFVASLNETLSRIGYKVSRVSSEKFVIDKHSATFSAAVWLFTTKTEQGDEANHGG